jgi:hypothetical protein
MIDPMPHQSPDPQETGSEAWIEARVEALIRESLTEAAARLLTPRERALLEADLRAFLLGSPQGLALLQAFEPDRQVDRSGDVGRKDAQPAKDAETTDPPAAAQVPGGRR